VNFAHFWIRHFIRHSFNDGRSSKSDGWFTAKKEGEVEVKNLEF